MSEKEYEEFKKQRKNAGVGGLRNFIDIADNQDRAEMMSMQQIMGNLEEAGHNSVGYGA